MRKPAFFRRLLYSYLLIMMILLVIFFAAVLFVSDRLARERYDAEIAAAEDRVSGFSDDLMRDLTAIEDAIDASPVFSRLYFSVVDGGLPSSSESSDIMTALKGAYSLAGRYDIVDIALFVNGLDYAYMPSGIQMLDEPFGPAFYPVPYLEYGSFSTSLQVEALRYTFYRPGLLYLSDFSYQGGAGHGVIAISIDSDRVGRSLMELVPEGSGVMLMYNGQPFMEFGTTEAETVELRNRRLPRFSIAVSFPEYSFISYASPASVLLPIAAAAFAFLLVFILSIYFTRRNYRPISLMRSLIPGSEEEMGDEIDSMIDGIRGIIGEVNASRDTLSRIRPYAEEGAFHGLLVDGSGALDLGRSHYIVAAAGFDVPDGEDDVRAIINRVVSAYSDENTAIYPYRRDAATFFLVIASDAESDPDALMSGIHSFITGSLSPSSSVTIGVDRWRSDIHFFRDSCISALGALDTMIVRGKGDIYFASDSEEAGDSYFFPPDTEVRLLKLVREEDKQGVRNFLSGILRRNLMTYDLSASGVKGLSEELYYAIVHVARIVAPGHAVRRLGERLTLEEVFAQGGQELEMMMDEADSSASAGSVYDELEAYVDSHFASPDLSQKLLSDMFGISTKSISLHYSGRYGMTYIEYVTGLRIGRAKELLLSPEVSIERAAELSGYQNTLTFRRNFKDATGLTPSEYREKLRQ